MIGVLVLCFLLLLAFRSLLVPLKAVVMNIFSIAAAFGVVIVLHQRLDRAAVGLDGAVPIVSFVPLMMFAILFGLSMDYEVFLMTPCARSTSRAATRAAVVEGWPELLA